jgi:diguanylate cyclase (GGDEF)-like protein
MGDSWQALRVLGDAVASHGDAAPPLPHLIAVNGLTAVAIGAFHRLNGCAPPAEPAEMLARARTSAERARTLLGRIPNSSYEIAVLGNLGEVLLHQGELSQAGSLLQRAHATARTQNQHAHRWRVEATLGHWLLATEQPGQALALVEATLAEMGPDAPAQTAQRAHHVAYLAQRSLGRYKRALEHFEQVERIDRRRTTAQLRALSELFVTRIEAQQALSQAELARQEAQAQRQRAAEALEAAERDPLTGLGNRRRLTRLFGEELPRHQRAMAPLAVALIDIDHFKPINDEFGHPTGDAVLTAVAQLLRENMRAGDVVARMGGEEFVAVLRETAPARALETCERLRERIARHVFPMLPAERRITVSIGVAHVPPYDSAALLRAADGALYEAKRGGRDRVRAAGGP